MIPLGASRDVGSKWKGLPMMKRLFRLLLWCVVFSVGVGAALAGFITYRYHLDTVIRHLRC
jgi:hypothetical protein